MKNSYSIEEDKGEWYLEGYRYNRKGKKYGRTKLSLGSTVTPEVLATAITNIGSSLDQKYGVFQPPLPA